MKTPLWKFTNKHGDFISETANLIKSLYFPLCNNSPLMSSITPDLHGDIKADFNSFLLEPASRSSLVNSRSSRNFWIYLKPGLAWSATGVSRDLAQTKRDTFLLEAGMFWHKITRMNKNIGLKAEITSFIPSSGEPLEIMTVAITNISSRDIKFIPTAAIPLFARSANNLHDHRHVTSLLNRIETTPQGVIVTPTLSFNESGHKKNETTYFVFGCQENGVAPLCLFPTQEEFIADNSDLEAPEAVLHNRPAEENRLSDGKEPMGGLRFRAKLLKPGKSSHYVIGMGITQKKEKRNAPQKIFARFNTLAKADSALQETKKFWIQKSSSVEVATADPVFDKWFRWVSIQPILRKIFGCSFLPDFDYGKGGRGWRDLWQDCLSLILLDEPSKVRPLLINNFSGVRIDGSNATIIGQKAGEFLADRNNISRIWMDHGIWPLITTMLYIHQTADLGILLEETCYFRDRLLSRNKERDLSWNEDYGKLLKTSTGSAYKGTVLEHLLVENLVQFFNVGPHNHIRLENADWNDGLDMAAENGESVAFSALYAQNLNSICELLEKLRDEHVTVCKELRLLLDAGYSSDTADHSDPAARTARLNAYLQAVHNDVNGEKISVRTSDLIYDLRNKAERIAQQIQKTEWLENGFFNGYYDNNCKQVEGKINGTTRMTLTGQVFQIMSGIASKEQISLIFRAACKHLKDRQLGGFRLNTDFSFEQLSLGRAFSFSYGDKENGAFFNHMSVMFAYALYKRGFVKEGYEVISSIPGMALNSQKSKIYPCLPEYFNAQGRGMYNYLTGSASWFIFTYLTQVFGIRGCFGDLMLEPKLLKQQFDKNNSASVTSYFADKKISVQFLNPQMKDYGEYTIKEAYINERSIAIPSAHSSLCLDRGQFLQSADLENNILRIILG